MVMNTDKILEVELKTELGRETALKRKIECLFDDIIEHERNKDNCDYYVIGIATTLSCMVIELNTYASFGATFMDHYHTLDQNSKEES